MYKYYSRGPVRQIIDESLVWESDGFAIYEVLSCGHAQPIKIDEETGMSNAQCRMCRKCKDFGWDRIDLTNPNYDNRSENWYEELIAIGKVPLPYEGYNTETHPHKNFLNEIKTIHQVITL